MITKEYFENAVGHPPELDDLDRCNCKEEGKVGHLQCGWCQTTNRPRFMCSCLAIGDSCTHVTVIDINATSWRLILQAVEESNWIPPEYAMNDWVADVCSFLRSRN